MENQMIFIGALGAFFLATAATMVSDMHGIGDWYLASLQQRKLALNPAVIFGAPYKIAGYFGEPLLIISIGMLTVGLLWKLVEIPCIHCIHCNDHRHPVYFRKNILELRHH